MTLIWFIVCAFGAMVFVAAVEWAGYRYAIYKTNKELNRRLRNYIGRPNENEGNK